MAIGIITGHTIAKNRDGDKARILLQVKMLDEDIRTVEMFSQHGEDTNPAKGCRVFVVDAADAYKLGIAVSDDLTPEVDAGEKEFYSTDNPATTKKARIKFNGDGVLDLNGDADNAVSWDDLNTALQTMLTALNADIVAAGGAGTTTLDISLAKVDEVKLP